MTDFYRFARAYGNDLAPSRFRRARVISTANNKVSLCMDSATLGTTPVATHTNVPYFGTIPPKVGESVWVVVVGSQLVCLGSTAAEGGDTPIVQLTRSGNQTTGLTTSGYVDLVWDAEYGAGDPWGMHTLSPASADVSAPIRGLYSASATVAISANSAGTYRGVRIVVDGTVRAAQQIVFPSGTVGSALNTILNVSWIGRMAGGQIIKVQFGHDTGTNLQAVLAGGGPHFSVAYIGAAAL